MKLINQQFKDDLRNARLDYRGSLVFAWIYRACVVAYIVYAVVQLLYQPYWWEWIIPFLGLALLWFSFVMSRSARRSLKSKVGLARSMWKLRKSMWDYRTSTWKVTDDEA